VVEWTLGYVGKFIWLLADHKATINSPDGGRFQRDQQGNLRCLHASKREII
jgi:hypothetical protein